jgi:hypothetical protein
MGPGRTIGLDQSRIGERIWGRREAGTLLRRAKAESESESESERYGKMGNLEIHIDKRCHNTLSLFHYTGCVLAHVIFCDRRKGPS